MALSDADYYNHTSESFLSARGVAKAGQFEDIRPPDCAAGTILLVPVSLLQKFAGGGFVYTRHLIPSREYFLI